MAGVALAQTPETGKAAEFEAASVKAQKPDQVDASQPDAIFARMPLMRGGPGTGSPGRIRYTNVTLMAILTKAYDLMPDQVAGPAWLKQDRYTIEAVLPPDTTAEQFRRMLQRLIADRFQLRAQWEEREFKVYRLVVAEGGPKLKASAVVVNDEDADPLATRAAAASAKLDSRGCPMLAPDRRAAIGRGHCMTYVGWSMAELAATSLAMMIANETGTNFGPKASWAHVVDETGLASRFDFSLDYDAGYYLMRNVPNLLAGSEPARSGGESSIFKAVETQLGLRLQPVTSRLKVMLIQSVERVPIED